MGRRARVDLQKERIRKRLQAAKRDIQKKSEHKKVLQSEREQLRKPRLPKKWKGAGGNKKEGKVHLPDSGAIEEELWTAENKALERRIRTGQEFQRKSDDLTLPVAIVQFGERVDAPPQFSRKQGQLPLRRGLQCVKTLECQDLGTHGQLSGGLFGPYGARMAAIKAYRKQKATKNPRDSGRATMQSLSQLVMGREEHLKDGQTRPRS